VGSSIVVTSRVLLERGLMWCATGRASERGYARPDRARVVSY
jgi:hypothetical protein